jgi:hypothetical protein
MFTFNTKNNDAFWLKVKSKLGCENTAGKTTVKIVPLPDAGFTFQMTGSIYSFKANDTNGIHEWNGPDGLKSTSAKASFDLSAYNGKNVKIIHKRTLNGCQGTDSLMLFIQLQSMASFGRNAWLKVYPNPATSLLLLESSAKGTIEICNIHGKTTDLFDIETKKELNISHLKNGVYTIKLNTNLGYYSTRFVVLQ